jgi:OPA family glycerol-3-phosphate transporter-like MFS transporter
MLLLGLVQGALAPASMTMIANWYPNKTRGSGIAIWNTSQNVGGAGLPLMIAGLAAWTGPGHVSYAFWVPGVLVLLISFLFWRIGGDRPEVEGLPSLDTVYGAAGTPQSEHSATASYWKVARAEVFTNKVVFILAAINAALYFLRFGILNWMPAFLGTEMGFTQAQYSMAFSALEWVAIPGSFFFAWLSVRMPNRQSMVGCIGLAVLAGLIIFYMGNRSYPLLLVTSGLMGMLVYGPQLIVNILTLNLVPLRVAGVAIGFVGLSGYLIGELCANLIMPIMAENFSWNAAITFLAATALGAGLLYMTLRSSEEHTVKVNGTNT